MDIKELNHMEELGDWLNANGMLGTAAEIGIAHGGNARIMLSKWKGRKMYLIDPWIQQSQEVYREGTNQDAPFENWHDEVVAFSKIETRAVPIRAFSPDISLLIPDKSLCSVYLDGNHSYKAVLEDMDAWYPKVEDGGVFGGHDFYDCTTYPYFNEVESAVKLWANEHAMSYHLTSCSSWWMIKEKTS